MDSRYVRLLESIRSAVDGPPTDLRTALAGLPDAGQLPPPWDAWMNRDRRAGRITPAPVRTA